MEQKRVLCVVGTRPEVIKMASVVHALEKIDGIKTALCLSGQHEEMVTDALALFHLRPAYQLHLMQRGQSLHHLACQAMEQIGRVIDAYAPHCVVVHGDTTTALCAAQAAFYRRVPIAHVEAGLRTYDIAAPYPEEWNRQAIDACAHWLFAPTALARQRLLREGKQKDRITVTGNTVIDALQYTEKTDCDTPLLQKCRAKRYLLLTAHRRENHGTGIDNICQAARTLCQRNPDLSIVIPVHPNPQVQDKMTAHLANHAQIILCRAQDTLAFHHLLRNCYFVLTDSGGVQEEASYFHKPVLVLRDCTERQEGLAAGVLRCVGTQTDGIVAACEQLLFDRQAYAVMQSAASPFGDGRAGVRIAERLAQDLCQKTV